MEATGPGGRGSRPSALRALFRKECDVSVGGAATAGPVTPSTPCSADRMTNRYPETENKHDQSAASEHDRNADLVAEERRQAGCQLLWRNRGAEVVDACEPGPKLQLAQHAFTSGRKRCLLQMSQRLPQIVLRVAQFSHNHVQRPYGRTGLMLTS